MWGVGRGTSWGNWGHLVKWPPPHRVPPTRKPDGFSDEAQKKTTSGECPCGKERGSSRDECWLNTGSFSLFL